MAAPIIENVQRGADLGGMLTSAGQSGLARLQQQLQFGQQFVEQQAQQQITREQHDRNLTMQLSQQRDMQQAQIDAAAQRQKSAADEALKRMTVQYGLEGQVKRDAFDNELSKMREQARLTAQNTEYTYTTKQRIEDAKFARAEQAIKTNQQFSRQERDEALRRLSVARAGIREPTEILGDPNKPKYPEGEEPGVRITADDGAIWSREMDGNWRLHQSAKDSIQYLQKQSQAELQLKQLEIQAKREQAITETRAKLLADDVRIVGPDGKAVYRRRTPEEVDEIVSSAFGIERQIQPAQQGEQPWWERATQNGLMVEESDLAFPEEVGGSIAFIRTVKARFGDQVPDELRKAYEQAALVVSAYAAQNTKSTGERTEYPPQSKFKPRS